MATKAELLLETGSAEAEVMLVVLVIKPAMFGLTVMVTVAVELLVNVPTLHVTTPFV